MVNLTGEDLRRRYAAGERDFEGVILHRASLHRAVLTSANFSRSNFSNANLGKASLHSADLGRANLSRANLAGADLSGADLSDADLHGANLGEANLSHTNLRNANLNDADLRGANLSDAKLRGASLLASDLRRADLSRAILSSAILNGADLRGANLSDAKSDPLTKLGATVLAGVNLSAFCLGGVFHASPSTIDHESVIRSVGAPQLKEFLRRSGMPDVFVEYMVDCARSLDPQQVFSLLRTTFISYGGPDELFARKLNAALEAQGVTTFFFKDDAPPGERLHRVMRKGINEHDRVILICSQSSLDRPGLLNELEETLAREARDGGNTYLIPVSLDDYVRNGWNPQRSDLAQAVRDRVIADFRTHEDEEAFRAEIAKLIAVLKKPPKVAAST